MRLEVSEGKYTFLTREDDYRIYVLRHGEPWLTFEAGHKALIALMLELEETRELLAQQDHAGKR